MTITFMLSFLGEQTAKKKWISELPRKKKLFWTMLWFQVIRNNETCISISDNDLVTGNNVRLNEFMLLLTIYTIFLLSKINFKVLILKHLIEVPMKEPQMYHNSCVVFNLVNFFDREHYLRKTKSVATTSNNSSYQLYQLVGNESLPEFSW